MSQLAIWIMGLFIGVAIIAVSFDLTRELKEIKKAIDRLTEAVETATENTKE